MAYMDRPAMIHAAEALQTCLRNGSDEDAQQWALQILNGLYGTAVGQYETLRNAVERGLRSADHTLGTPE